MQVSDDPTIVALRYTSHEYFQAICDNKEQSLSLLEVNYELMVKER